MAQKRPYLDMAARTLNKTKAHLRVVGQSSIECAHRYSKGWLGNKGYKCAKSSAVRAGPDRERLGNMSGYSQNDSVFRGWIRVGTHHLLYHWCRVQAMASLGAAEAELYAQVHGCNEGVVQKNM